MALISLLRLPAKVRRRVRRNRMATLALLSLLVLLLLLPFYIIYAIYYQPRYLVSYMRNKYPDVLFAVDLPDTPESRIIALSLDDAPSQHTEEILDILHANDAHATFFVIGSQVDGPERKGLLRKMIKRGHELANHAMRDESSRALHIDELEQQLYDVKAKLTEAYEAEGRILPNNYFRPGSGFFNFAMRDRLGNRGFRITLGSVYPHDPQIPYPDVNARHIVGRAHPGGIIICHDRRRWTAPMLRIMLPELKRRGYKIVTITELIKHIEPLGGR